MEATMVVPYELRLSALRAFLGRIHPSMRLVKAKFIDDTIVVTVVLDQEPTEKVHEDISEATTEIIADFSVPHTIAERIEVSSAPVDEDDVLTEGWIYRRAE
jgi:hypothetical protein